VVHIVITITEHRAARSVRLFLDRNASDEKKFSALQKKSHCKKSRLWQRVSSTHIGEHRHRIAARAYKMLCRERSGGTRSARTAVDRSIRR
jgi:hypothetical protein